MSELPVKLGSVCTQRVEIVGQLQPRAFESAICLTRKLKVLAQLFDFGLKRGCFPVNLVELGAQGLVGRAGLGQHARQAQGLRFFLFKRAQRAVERRHQLVEGRLEVIEFADLAPGVGQEVAQDLVFLAHARADIGQVFNGDWVAAVAVSACQFVGPRQAFAAKKVRQLRHNDASPTPKRLRTAPKRRSSKITILYTFDLGNTRSYGLWVSR